MNNLIAPEPLILSTPRSKLISDVSLPVTPNKRPRTLDPFSNGNLTPSKKLVKLQRTGLKTNPRTVIPQVLTFDTPLEHPNEMDSCNNKNLYDDILSRRLHLDNKTTSPTSPTDLGSISPLSDISSIPSLSASSSPDIAGFDSKLDPFNTACFMMNWNGSKSLINNETLELNRMIKTSMGRRRTGGGDDWKHSPCHRTIKPKRSILNLEQSSLNLIVSSSRGSLKDATIFATEINSSTSNEDDGNKLPIISNIWERITIPVNSSIKKKHKERKERFLRENELDLEDLDDSNGDVDADMDESIPDAALIRGYDFKYLNGKSGKGRNVKANTLDRNKSVNWATPLAQ
ncbi:Sfg1p NDAI_0E00510 [Naumovozyma dairenensis CBS 421]|uniref:Uncharacterized protein n=1 Tax=Naumovozyma dairenensis (strain ATCC 10597 / BCRC 20456 / CBS 421 / NBRC 0211 / NRRL Y-12639) TaxID=1071378 RepID=G0WAU7_NAUDC|nr:hypothetical protein NDAI_0E00510 [Naumovozyma dairenensis CBS 421]CCD24867.1 hypothetical protein NDAI_0E00510 [Naumovozyma dairenensis CBS 421]